MQQTESFYERDARLRAERIADFAPGVAAKHLQTYEFIEQGDDDVIAIEGD